MGARDYDPTTGRFLTEDPLPPREDAPSSLALYNFAENNPNVFSDPTGKFSLVEMMSSTGVQNTMESIQIAAVQYGKQWAKEQLLDFGRDVVLNAISSMLPIQDLTAQLAQSLDWALNSVKQVVFSQPPAPLTTPPNPTNPPNASIVLPNAGMMSAASVASASAASAPLPSGKPNIPIDIAAILNHLRTMFHLDAWRGALTILGDSLGGALFGLAVEEAACAVLGNTAGHMIYFEPQINSQTGLPVNSSIHCGNYRNRGDMIGSLFKGSGRAKAALVSILARVGYELIDETSIFNNPRPDIVLGIYQPHVDFIEDGRLTTPTEWEHGQTNFRHHAHFEHQNWAVGDVKLRLVTAIKGWLGTKSIGGQLDFKKSGRRQFEAIVRYASDWANNNAFVLTLESGFDSDLT